MNGPADGLRFPPWLKRTFSVHGQWSQAKELVQELGLHTVCQEARCPNLGECWSHGNVSFMILGDRCTRACTFCAVTTARPLAVDETEPDRLAEGVLRLRLKYVVVTSVARDDLPDQGSGMFAACVQAIKGKVPEVQVEVLTPDFHANPEWIEQVVQAGPEVYSHNLETIHRLSREVRPQADYRRSLQVLRLAKQIGGEARLPRSGDRGGQGMKTKSGLMVGLGETQEEIREAMIDLREVGCEILTIGQYLQPTLQHRRVSEYLPPEAFERYRALGMELGFGFVASGPYVRSSYNAFEAMERTEAGGWKLEAGGLRDA